MHTLKKVIKQIKTYFKLLIQTLKLCLDKKIGFIFKKEFDKYDHGENTHTPGYSCDLYNSNIGGDVEITSIYPLIHFICIIKYVYI